MYRRGVDHRLAKLAEEYGVTAAISQGALTFVDVGANIGEFGIACSGIPHSTYVAFEPDPIAFAALTKNVSHGFLVNKAVSDYEGEGALFLATDKADTSLVMPTTFCPDPVETSVTTVDAALRALRIRKVDILKVEAEGSEPEVLRGATETLARTRMCVVDAGPERGGSSTAPDCVRLLLEAGFEFVDLRFPRGILVFVNSNYEDTPKTLHIG